MAQKRPAFRFRIPWLSGTSESSSRRLKDTSKSSTPLDTNVPIQTPSMPSLITPIKSPPSPTKTHEITEPQNQSPPHPIQPTPSLTSLVVENTQSKTPSPSTSPNHVNSPTSSSHAASQAHAISTQPLSPSNYDTMKVPKPNPSSSEESPCPTSPEVSKNELDFQHHLPSPLASERKNVVLKANHEEKEKIPVLVPESAPNEAEPKMKSPLKIIHKSQPKNLTKHTTNNLDEKRSISKTTPKSPLEHQSKFLQHKEKEKEKEKEKVMHETKKFGKTKETSTNSQQNRHSKASYSGTKDKKHNDVTETVERKIMYATSNSSGKGIEFMSSKNQSSSISNQRTVPSSDEERKKGPIQKGIKDDITKFVHKIAASVQPTQPIEDKKFSVITLTGDNRGATMHVGSESDNKEGSIHIHRDYKNESEESIEVTTDGEEEDSTEHSEVGKAYVNSNIQSINNSLMFHGSINERDPGVQVTLTQKALENINRDDRDTHNHRTEFNISRSQKSFQPTVRRYGRKFSCGSNKEDIEIM